MIFPCIHKPQRRGSASASILILWSLTHCHVAVRYNYALRISQKLWVCRPVNSLCSSISLRKFERKYCISARSVNSTKWAYVFRVDGPLVGISTSFELLMRRRLARNSFRTRCEKVGTDLIFVYVFFLSVSCRRK